MNSTEQTDAKPHPLKEAQDFLGSWSLAIPLMFIIGLLAIVGALVPQGSISQTQASERIADWLKPVVIGMQFNDVYRSPVFMIPLLIFFVSLACVTADKVIPRLFGYYAPERFRYTPEQLQQLNPVIPYPSGLSDDNLKARLIKAGYRVVEQDSQRVFLEKHKIGRLAALVTHIGLFMLIIAAVVSSLTGFSGQFSLQTGQTKTMAEILESAEIQGKIKPASDWKIKLEDLALEPGEDELFSQTKSLVQFVDAHGQPASSGQIYTHHPLSYGSVGFYQLDWGLGGLEVQIGAQKHNLTLKHIPQMNASITPFQSVGIAQVTFFVDQSGDVYLFDGERQPMGTTLAPAHTITIENTPVRLESLDPKTHVIRLRLGNLPPALLELRKVPQMENMQLYVTPFQTIAGKKFTFVFSQAQPAQLLIFDEKFQPVVLPIKEGENRLVNGESLTLQKKLMFSQFHYRLDYGFPLLLFSLMVILLGLGLALFSHKEIWLVTLDGQRCLVGRCSKLQLGFLQELKRVFRSLDVQTTALENRSRVEQPEEVLQP